jgi:class 3 adenylate cyclase
LSTVAEADRRVITVMFADLTGFTTMTERVDPEDVRTLVSGSLDPLCEAVARWGGFVDKFIGDCVMALFGAPVAYENEPERAVRAALDMQAALEHLDSPAMSRLIQETGYTPKVKIGIATGPVVTGLFSGGGARNYTAVGDAVNVASRIEGMCDPGGILVDEATFRSTRHLFEFGESETVQVKGRTEPVQVRYVSGVRAERGVTRGIEGLQTPLVGRDSELRAMRERWSRAEQGRMVITALAGPAGIGKSRLVEELIAIEEIPAARVARGRSYPYASRSPWEPIAELFRDLYEVDPGAGAREAAERMIASALGGSEPHPGALSLVLGESVADAPDLVTLSPAERVELVRDAVIRCLAAAAGERRLLVLEDLHWADHATLEFLEHLLSLTVDAPILLVLIARPPLPGEEGLARVLESCRDVVQLPPLTGGQSEELLNLVLEPHEVPDRLLERIARRSDGNPLFLEETVKSLFEEGTFRRAEGVARAVGDPELVHVPESIESLLSTRIDGLNAEAKRVLQYAAIVGRRFWAGVVADALAHRPVDQELSALQDGALVRPESKSLVAGDREFVFEHLLMQEVAYEGLLKGLRSEAHEAVAAWLDARLGGKASEYDDWIAFHYERSRDPERAVPFLERAAGAARDRGALADAQELLARALGLAGDRETEARLLAAVEDVAGLTGDIDARRRSVERLEELARQSEEPVLLADAVYRRARLHLDSGDLSRARELGEEALERYTELGDISLEGDALRLLGRVEHLWGRYPEAVERYEAGLACEQEAGDEAGQADMYDRLGLVRVDQGDFDEGLDYLDRSRVLYEASGSRAQEARLLAHRATALRWLGSLEEAEETARAALELADAAGSKRARASAEVTLGMVLAAAGRGEARTRLQASATLGLEMHNRSLQARAWLALSELEGGHTAANEAVDRVLELCEGSGLVHLQVMALTRKAELLLEASRAAEADRASEEAIQRLRRHGNVQGPEEHVLMVRAQVLAALGRPEESSHLAEEARDTVRRKAERIRDDERRRRFMELPPNPQILGADVVAEGTGAP